MFNINFCHLGINGLSYNDILSNHIMFYGYEKQISSLYMKTTAAFQCVWDMISKYGNSDSTFMFNCYHIYLNYLTANHIINNHSHTL